ncbi:hypothetical protein KAR02_03755 [Candidatus Bipolaricaulota bacterium]|nr:hypothetical protein [Candidatus Bipolaricaulota bacterium]
MSTTPRTCRRCLLPEGKFNVCLDKSGLCNYCRFWDETGASLLDVERHRHLLVDRLQRFRGQFHYDAAVGLSGGKDSAYVLHQLTSKYQANVLSITFDNGFLTDYAWENIRGIVSASGVDHFVYRPDWEAFRTFYLAAVRKLSDPCVACSLGGYVLSIRGRRDIRAPFFVHGRSPMQMFRHWYPGTRDLGIGILRTNLKEHSIANLRKEYKIMIRKMRLLLLYLVPNTRLRHKIFRELFGSRLRGNDLTPEFLAFFLFEPYDEQEMVRHLEALDTGYRRPENHAILGHGDCLIHDVSAYLYEKNHGVNRVLPDVAAMLRQGLINQDDARDILVANTPSEEDVEISIGHLLERLEMTRNEFDIVVNRLNRKSARTPFL